MKLGRTDEIRITVTRPITSENSCNVVMILNKDAEQYKKSVNFQTGFADEGIDEFLLDSIETMINSYNIDADKVKESKPRLQLHDSMMEIVTKMSEGNPGAMAFIMDVISADQLDIVYVIMPLDTLGIYGSKLYMLWNDACDRDIEKVKKVIDAWRISELTKEEIHENLNRGRALPFKGLTDYETKK